MPRPPDRYQTARTELASGANLRRGRRRVAARPFLKSALGTFEELVARPWADRAAQELEATGETVRRRGVDVRDQLTPQERQIAQLLAAGRTTREAAAALFVSPKTVEYHLRHVYLKVDIRSRSALARTFGPTRPRGWRVAHPASARHPDHMRAIWKGAVSFGLVSVPVKLYSATESKDISFRQVHAKDGGRIKYQRTCSLDGEEVEYADIAKGYETEDGEMVILTDEDMAALPANSSREISVERFVPSEQIDPMLFEKSYYLEPEKSGAKPYALLREALEAADRMALVTVSLRNRTSLAVLRVRDDVIVMQTMMWPDEIRQADFGSVDTSEAKPAEVKMAKMLVETLAGDFDPSEFEDDYRGAVEAMVRAKIEGGDVKRTPAAKKSSGEVVDLLAALQRSVDAARSARGEQSDEVGDAAADQDAGKDAGQDGAADEDDEAQEPRKAGVRKSAAKKGATKKTAAQKTDKKPARKSARKQTKKAS
jgi:DNA end-binding protein Ku